MQKYVLQAQLNATATDRVLPFYGASHVRENKLCLIKHARRFTPLTNNRFVPTLESTAANNESTKILFGEKYYVCKNKGEKGED